MKNDRKEFIFTSESVARGHPDKICDQISDAILDMYLEKDPDARTAIETVATTNRVILAGEIKSKALIDEVDIKAKVRSTVKDIGYEDDTFHYEKINIKNYLHEQSPDISKGVDGVKTGEGAGDQGIMFGYACSDNEFYIPDALYFSNMILKGLEYETNIPEENNPLDRYKLGPDGKAQVTMRYEHGEPKAIEKILVSYQHGDGIDHDTIRDVIAELISNYIPSRWNIRAIDININPSKRFVIGGPHADVGLTGRKIIIDTYGGAAPHGGGAFSGKDPSKVDRTGAYAARYIAKNLVAAEVARECTVQLSYAIACPDLQSFYLDFHGTGKVSEEKVEKHILKNMDLTPTGIRERLNLNRPIYYPTSYYGHFGRSTGKNGEFPWEKTDMIILF